MHHIKSSYIQADGLAVNIMKLNHRNLYLIIPGLFAGVPLFLHAYLGSFSRYIADDFCSAYFAHRLGILRATWFWYLSWSGRYSASLLDSFVGLLRPGDISIVVPVTILIWLAALTVFFQFLLVRLKHSLPASLVLAITSLFTLFTLSPTIRQSLYWGQGMRSVIPPLIMGTIQVILVSKLRSRQWTNFQLGLWYTLGFFWTLVAGGFSETYASFQAAAMVFVLGVLVTRERFQFTTTSRFLIASLLGAIGALVIIVLAPGNSARQGFFPESLGIFGISTLSLKSFSLYVIHLFDSLTEITASLGLLCFAVVIGSQIEQKPDSHTLIIIPAITFASIFVCFPPAAYGLSDAPPGRTLMLPTYFFVLGLVAFGFVCGNFLRKKQTNISLKLVLMLAMIAIAISSSMASINLYRSRSEFIEYAIAWDETDAKIRQAKANGETQVLITIIPNWAALDTPNDNPRFWLNACMSSYYDVQILASPDSDSQ
jgi:hypothetical protein